MGRTQEALEQARGPRVDKIRCYCSKLLKLLFANQVPTQILSQALRLNPYVKYIYQYH